MLQGEEPVLACLVNDKEEVAHHYTYNHGKSNVPINPIDDVDDPVIIATKAADDVIYCKLSVPVKPTNNDALPNLNQTYNLLVARGSSNGQGKYRYLKIENFDFEIGCIHLI